MWYFQSCIHVLCEKSSLKLDVEHQNKDLTRKQVILILLNTENRSEERRVGKEC